MTSDVGDGQPEGESLSSTSGESALLFDSSGPTDELCVADAATGDLSDFGCLSVTFTDTVDEVVQRWERHAGGRPAALTVVTVGGRTRAAAAHGSDGTVGLPNGLRTAVVPDAGDLPELGMRISRCLDELAAEEVDCLVVCFDSLTYLLQFADLKRIFRFLHVLNSRIRESGARSHFHLTPEAHDEQAVATLRDLFPAVRDHRRFREGGAGEDSWPGEWTSAERLAAMRESGHR